MADYFTALQAFQAEVNAIREGYKREIDAYQAQSEVYKSEVIAYQTELINWQIAQASAVTHAESVIEQFAYWAKITKTWIIQSGIILILFVAILVLQKRKDIT